MWGEKDVKRLHCLNDNRNSLSTIVNNASGLRQNFISSVSIGGNKYVMPFEDSVMEQREKRYVKAALENVPRGTSVLNWPCERGQLLPLLKKLGYKVTSADSCSYAVMQARLYGVYWLKVALIIQMTSES